MTYTAKVPQKQGGGQEQAREGWARSLPQVGLGGYVCAQVGLVRFESSSCTKEGVLRLVFLYGERKNEIN